jgi:hypothetical protein
MDKLQWDLFGALNRVAAIREGSFSRKNRPERTKKSINYFRNLSRSPLAFARFRRIMDPLRRNFATQYDFREVGRQYGISFPGYPFDSFGHPTDCGYLRSLPSVAFAGGAKTKYCLLGDAQARS